VIYRDQGHNLTDDGLGLRCSRRVVSFKLAATHENKFLFTTTFSAKYEMTMGIGISVGFLGAYEKLGTEGHRMMRHVPRLIEVLAVNQVVGIAAGLWHTAAWTEEGELLHFGSNNGTRDFAATSTLWVVFC